MVEGLVQEFAAFDLAAADAAIAAGWLRRLVPGRRGRFDRASVTGFEQMAQESSDPWNYETSAYEQAKYQRTLEALPEETGETLELGCSVGVFTAMLAPRATRLLAVDFSPTALAHAESRLAQRPNVTLDRRVLPEEMPDGRFDTIVCAEILYYWNADLIRDGLARIEAALEPGGVFLAVHWRHGDGKDGLNGDQVHSLLRAETSLEWDFGDETADYRLDRFSAPG